MRVLLRACKFCGDEFRVGPDRRQVYCSVMCRQLHYSRTTNERARVRANDFLKRTDPKVARALVLNNWPELRTPEEQAALDRWLAERVEGVAYMILHPEER